MTTAATWSAAEATLRAHYTARGREILDIAAKRDASLGAAFWVRLVDGFGGLVLVRGDDVIDEPSPASVDRFIRIDDLVHRTQVTARDFLYVLTVWNALPALGAKPIEDHPRAALNPRWQRTGGRTAFVVLAARPSDGGDPNKSALPMRRATGTLGQRGISWTVEDVDVPLGR